MLALTPLARANEQDQMRQEQRARDQGDVEL
jgi:hypothetical protein